MWCWHSVVFVRQESAVRGRSSTVGCCCSCCGAAPASHCDTSLVLVVQEFRGNEQRTRARRQYNLFTILLENVHMEALRLLTSVLGCLLVITTFHTAMRWHDVLFWLDTLLGTVFNCRKEEGMVPIGIDHMDHFEHSEDDSTPQHHKCATNLSCHKSAGRSRAGFLDLASPRIGPGSPRNLSKLHRNIKHHRTDTTTRSSGDSSPKNVLDRACFKFKSLLGGADAFQQFCNRVSVWRPPSPGPRSPRSKRRIKKAHASFLGGSAVGSFSPASSKNKVVAKVVSDSDDDSPREKRGLSSSESLRKKNSWRWRSFFKRRRQKKLMGMACSSPRNSLKRCSLRSEGRRSGVHASVYEADAAHEVRAAVEMWEDRRQVCLKVSTTLSSSSLRLFDCRDQCGDFSLKLYPRTRYSPRLMPGPRPSCWQRSSQTASPGCT